MCQCPGYGCQSWMMIFSFLQSGRENWTGNATVRRRGSSLSDEMKGRCYCSVVTLAMAMAMAALALSSPLASLLLSFCCFLFLSLFTIYSFFPSTFTLFSTTQNLEPSPNFPTTSQTSEIPNTVQSSGLLKVYVVDLPREFNYGLLEQYYNGRRGRQKLWFEEGEALDWGNIQNLQGEFLPYPENPTWKQYSAEYWLLADLMTDGAQRGNSPAVRVMKMEEAEIFFVPFFAALSAEIQLGEGHGNFRHKVQENGDYVRQLAVLDFVMKTEAWQRSGGRDHVFVLTGVVYSYATLFLFLAPHTETKQQPCCVHACLSAHPVQFICIMWKRFGRSHGHVACAGRTGTVHSSCCRLRRLVHGGRKTRWERQHLHRSRRCHPSHKSLSHKRRHCSLHAFATIIGSVNGHSPRQSSLLQRCTPPPQSTWTEPCS